MFKSKPMLRVPQITQRTLASSLSPSAWPFIFGAMAVSALVVGLLWLLCSWLIDWIAGGWMSWDWLIGFLQGAAALGLAWMLFPLLIPAFIGMFVNQLAAKIDRREYADRPQGQDLPFLPEFKMDLGFALYALLLNLLILPIYLIPGINLIIYYVLNAHLLGKQYFMMISRRHMDPIALKAHMKQHRWGVYVYGLLIVVASTLPLANLLTPAFATAMMVHVYQQLADQPEGGTHG